ncbi:Hypothetical protein FKW44_016135, partial [Caligus rogercresseyi]
LYQTNKRQQVKCCQDLLKLFQDHGEDYLGSHLLVLVLKGLNGAEEDLDGARGGPVLDPLFETDCQEDDDRDGFTC